MQDRIARQQQVDHRFGRQRKSALSGKTGHGSCLEKSEYGPFPTLLEAVRDMQYRDESEVEQFEPGETLEEAESDIGIADWVDAETGEPAEENPPRLEEH